MEINRLNVFEIIEKSSLKADKDYGQNYLVEPNISEEIVSFLDINESNSVLEIGPGLGSLTHFVQNYRFFTIVDIDRRMTDFLSIIYQDKEMSLVCNDVRKIDVSSFDKILGNLPYNITTELVVFLLINAKKVKKMTLMCQAEAFSRFSDLSGKNYGPVSILIHLLGTVNKNLLVKAGSFTPVPKCNSIVFTFTRNSNLSYDTAISVYKFVKTLFMNRRKTISNNLKSILKNKDDIDYVLSTLKIDPLKRPEDISVEKYSDLFFLVKSKLK